MINRLAIHFARFGPYHLARIGAAAKAMDAAGWKVAGLETSGNDATYAWKEEIGKTGWERRTVFPGEVLERISAGRLRAGMTAALDELRPDAVAIAGWGSPDARACLDWCRRHGAKAIVMSETREADGHRVWWKERIKSRIVKRFDAALVGGKSHRDYLVKLGMPSERVAFGYNVVDNDYFSDASQKVLKSEDLEGGRCFLASNRFIERKNLLRLIEAFAKYGLRVGDPTTDSRQPTTRPWHLCLLGDGGQKPALVARCRELGLHVEKTTPWGRPTTDNRQPTTVFFPGFRQIDELPRFYAHAGCFIHPALEEPWGLVLNEAMACGLPVLSGGNVGAAEELVDDGVNGWKFEATNVDEMAELMFRVSAPGFPLSAFGAASARILEERCPAEKFGKGLVEILEGGG